MSTFKASPGKLLRAPTNLWEEGVNVYNRSDSFKASFGDAMKTMVDTVSFKNSVGNWWAGQEDKKNGEAPITREYFDKYNELYKVGLDYKEDEMPSQFALRLGNKLRANLKRSRINDVYGATNFIGGMLPELANPANLIPFSRLATLGKLASKTNIAMSQGRKFSAAFGAYKDYFKEALISNAALEPLYYVNAQQIGDDYTLQDSAINILFGTAFGTATFGTVAAATKYKRANRVTQQAQLYEEMYSFMESGEYNRAVNVAFNSDPKFANELSKHKELGKIIREQTKDGGAIDINAFTDDQLNLMAKDLIKYYDLNFEGALTQTLAEELAEELNETSDVPAREISFKYKTKYLKMLKAHKAQNLNSLTDEELATYRKLKDSYEGEVYDEPILEMKTPKQPLDFKAAADSQKLGTKIKDILLNNRVETLSEAVEKGVIGRQEANFLLEAFNNSYGKAYAAEIEIANRAVSEIFGVNFKIKTPRMDGMPRALGWVQPGFPDVINLARAAEIADSDLSTGSIIFHEAMHTLQQFDPESWDKVYQAIENQPKLFAELKRIVTEDRKYYSGVKEEIPSVFMEWAVSQKEFWRELATRDRTFFEKFRDLLNKLFISVRAGMGDVAVLKDKAYMKKLVTSGTPEDLARHFARILNESRAKRVFDSEAKVVQRMIDTNTRISTRVEEPVYQDTAYTDTQLDEPFIPYSTAKTAQYQNPIYRDMEELLARFRSFDYLAEDSDPQMFLELYEKYKNTEAPETEAQRFLEEMLTVEGREALMPFFKEFFDISKQMYLNQKLGVVEDYVTKNLSDIKNVNLDLGRFIKSQLDQLPPDGDATALVSDIITNHYYKKLHTVFLNIAAKARIAETIKGKKGKLKIETLRSLLDGQERKNVDVQSSLYIDMEANAEADSEILLQVLFDYGLFDLFFGADDTEWIKAYRGTPAERETLQKFGANIKRASEEFHNQLMSGLRENTLPEGWRGTKGLEVLFETIQKIENFQLNKLNKVGAYINKLSDYAGVSQRWDQTIVATMSKEEFIADMSERIDAQETIRRHQGVFKVKDSVVPLTEANFAKWLGSWYDEIKSGKVADEAGARIDARKSRLVKIKPEYEMETILKYSGYDNVGKLMLEQIQQKARTAVLAVYGGTEPKKMFDSFARGSANNINKKSYLATVDYMVGDLQDPVDAEMSSFFQTINDLSDILFLSGSGISTLTDIPMVAATLKYQGVSLGETNGLLVDAYKDAIKRRFSDDKTGMSNFLRAQGAGYDVILNSVARRMTADTGTSRNLIGKAKKMFFKLNGLNALTSAHQEMYFDVLTRGIAEELKIWNDGGNMDDFLREGLLDAGIEEAEFETLYRSIQQTPDGVDRIGVQFIQDKRLAMALRTYFKKYMRQAVFMPDPGTYAQATFGFKKGTYIGELAGVATRYQPFMLGMSKLIYRRFANGYYGNNNRNMMMMSHLVSYIGTALAVSYVATIIKDLLRGKEPINISNMTGRQMSRIVQQSGILGILEVPLDAMDYGPLEATSPLASTVFGGVIDVGTGNIKGAQDKLSALTGGNIIGPGEWIHGMIGAIFGEVTNEIQQDSLDYVDKY